MVESLELRAGGAMAQRDQRDAGPNWWGSRAKNAKVAKGDLCFGGKSVRRGGASNDSRGGCAPQNEDGSTVSIIGWCRSSIVTLGGLKLGRRGSTALPAPDNWVQRYAGGPCGSHRWSRLPKMGKITKQTQLQKSN